MKNMSFGKLMAIFGGIFVVVIIAAVVIIKMTNSTKQGASVVTQRHQQPQQEQKPDVLGERLKAQQDLQNSQAASAAQTQIMQQTIQQGNTAITQRLDSLASDITAIDQRLLALEGKRATSEIVVKSPRKQKISAIKQLAKGATPIPTSSGYKVQSTVGARAWVDAGEHSDSVSVGETLPPVAKVLRVRAVDSDSGIVITTHDH